MTAAKPKRKPAARKAPAKPRRTHDERAAIVERICARLEQAEALHRACVAEGTTNPTFLRWMAEDSALADKYTRAREVGLHLMAQQIIDISDEQDVEARYQGEDVRLDLSATAVARNRLRVDARKWLLSKMLPKVYGEKLAIGGAEDLGPLKTMPDEALEAKIAELMAKANASQG